MLNHLEFISRKKSMLIAPAGFGKTHTIAECLKHSQHKGKQLILTHTHAGVASIKEKIKKECISTSCYSVETITGFAQKYVLSFYNGNDIPKQEDSKTYYPFITNKAIELFRLKPIKQIVSSTYDRLFVDEYQDCTIKQHELVLLLSELLPTHIFGDFLQGIFGFHGEQLVDMESNVQMGDFAAIKYELDKPQRWLYGNNNKLGEDLKRIRAQLIKRQEVDLTAYPSIEVHLTNDIYTDKYNFILNLLDSEQSFLILDPMSANISNRVTFIQRFKNMPILIESIDDKDFYSLSKEADLITTENVVEQLMALCYKLFNKTGLDNWFNEKGFKKKSKEEDKILSQLVQSRVQSLNNNISFSIIAEVLKKIGNLPDIKCYRKELFTSFCKALEGAEHENVSVLKAMTNKRNAIRRIGKKIFGRCIGTTLLTKGLEFDTVAIINAHKFDCPKHLYVALTRTSKRLLIFTENKSLNPYK